MTEHRAFKHIWACVAVFMAGIASAGTAQFAGGTGEPNAPYQIASCEQLIALGNDPNLWDKHFVLINDLDMKGADPNAMHPIGNAEGYPFVGVFDGRDHTVSGLRILRQNDPWVGFFGKVGGEGMDVSEDLPKGHVQNLHLRDIVVHGGNVVGGLAGELSAGTITGCSVTGVIEGDEFTGGLVGWAHGEIKSCRSVVDVHGDMGVGGLIGDAHANVMHCASSGNVYGRRRVAGLIGTMGFSMFTGMWQSNSQETRECTKVSQCCSDCSVTGEEEVGGLIAAVCGAGEIRDCYTVGPVEGSTKVGGLIGVAWRCCVVRCFSAGQVPDQEHAGGLIGENVPVENAEKLVEYPPCQFIVEEVPSSSNGERRWRHVYRPAILSCLWDAEASRMTRGLGSGADAQGGIVRLTTAEMRKAASFCRFGWDFDSVWTIRGPGLSPIAVGTGRDAKGRLTTKDAVPGVFVRTTHQLLCIRGRNGA